MASFGQRLLELRKHRNLKQRELAELMGISLRAWQYYESGEKRPDYEGLLKLADFFEVSLDYITGKTDEKKIYSSDRGLEAEFLKWVEENLEEEFYYDFDASPEEAKAQMMADLRYLWEREKKRGKKGDK